MTPSETFVRTVNKYPRGSTITIGGVSLAAVLAMVGTVYGFGLKVGEVKHDIEDNTKHIEVVRTTVAANTAAIISMDKGQALLISEITHLKKALEELNIEQKSMRTEILTEIKNIK